IIISANAGRGVGIAVNAGVPLGPGNIVSFNYIGTDITGTTALGNGPFNSAGVGVDTANNTITDNLISGGFGYGVNFATTTASNNTVLRNRVGTNAAGTAADRKSV